MAKFKVPEFVVNSKAGNQGKWHLLASNGLYANQGVTVCNRYAPEWEKLPISEVKAECICQKCLGALKVED